ncbi:uncharacterized protein [Rutidosis leptorrhynchoides]|uniref:uncharacterized protein n=1 Tax=Rutidosis leptorrhynchoides TaxID=125765 RepID=UPI003A98D2A1
MTENEIQKLKGKGTQVRSGTLQHTRFTKIEFPRFDSTDVKEWIYSCKKFFTVDNVEDDEKIRIISIQLQKKSLTWHQQFIKINGSDNTYEEAILRRFGTVVKDPLSELNNLRQTSYAEAYFEKFEALLNKIELRVKQAIMLFLAGLNKEIELMVRMFKPKTLEEAYGLAKLQEDTIAITKKKV